jgi:cupin fold WbuC family metalloprotein
MFLKESNEVYYSNELISLVDIKIIERLKSIIVKDRLNKIRLCLHKSKHELVHEMLIIHSKDAYVRPHKHSIKLESITVIEGYALYVEFDDCGGILRSVGLGPYGKGVHFLKSFENKYHMLIVESEYFVFQEVTQGPFGVNSSIFPEWAPDKDSEHKYINGVVEKCSRPPRT